MKTSKKWRYNLTILEPNTFFFSGVVWDWVNSVRRWLSGLLYRPWMMDDDGCGAVGGMIDRGNLCTERNPAPVPLNPPQIPHDLTRAAAVGSQLLTQLSTLLSNFTPDERTLGTQWRGCWVGPQRRSERCTFVRKRKKSVGTAMGYGIDGLCSIPDKCTAFRPPLGPTQPPLHCVPRVLYWAIPAHRQKESPKKYVRMAKWKKN
jgi:hypothetical protein